MSDRPTFEVWLDNFIATNSGSHLLAATYLRPKHFDILKDWLKEAYEAGHEDAQHWPNP